ncbi:MAG: glycosyltransferase family 4 protein [Chthoniobacterales bacterium]|nr:glycosyltransferase family 4 protein [Chthoniobacterales bacterium]
MKILMVNDYAVPVGGAETIMYDQRDWLRRRGHEVRIFASDAQIVPAGRPEADYLCRGTTTRFQAVLSAFNPSASAALAKALDDFNPDVVHVKMFLWQLSPSILGNLEGRAAVYEIMTYKPVCPMGTKLLPGGQRCTKTAGAPCLLEGCLTPQSWVAMMVQRMLWLKNRKVFTRLVTISRTMRQRLEENGLGPCSLITNGCHAQSPRRRLSSSPLFSYSGRLSPEKGVDTLLRAVQKAIDRAPEIRLLIAGDGPQRKNLEALSRELGIHRQVCFLGHLERTEMEKALEEVWAQIVPSQWEEPFGVVTTEAMMRGTAVIASNHGGCAECVADGRTGLLFPAGDSDALADAISKLIQDKNLCEAMGSAGRDLALREYNFEKYATAWEDCYREVVFQHRSAAN